MAGCEQPLLFAFPSSSVRDARRQAVDRARETLLLPSQEKLLPKEELPDPHGQRNNRNRLGAGAAIQRVTLGTVGVCCRSLAICADPSFASRGLNDGV